MTGYKAYRIELPVELGGRLKALSKGNRTSISNEAARLISAALDGESIVDGAEASSKTFLRLVRVMLQFVEETTKTENWAKDDAGRAAVAASLHTLANKLHPENNGNNEAIALMLTLCQYSDRDIDIFLRNKKDRAA